MKIRLLLVIVLFCTSVFGSEVYDIKTAINQKVISCKFEGRNESPHYAQPLKVSVDNQSEKEVQIRIPNGQQLLCEDKTVQDLVVVKEEVFVLKGREHKELIFYAMCTKAHNSSPRTGVNYALGPVAPGALGLLAQEIEKRKQFNTLGQYAVWTISDKYELSEIAGFDEKEANYLMEFVSKITGRKIPPSDKRNYKTNYHAPELVEKGVGGDIEYKFARPSSVTIGMFNTQGIIVRELYNNPNESAGPHKLKFQFDAMAYRDPVYYIRLIVNGHIQINLKMDNN